MLGLVHLKCILLFVCLAACIVILKGYRTVIISVFTCCWCSQVVCSITIPEIRIDSEVFILFHCHPQLVWVCMFSIFPNIYTSKFTPFFLMHISSDWWTREMLNLVAIPLVNYESTHIKTNKTIQIDVMLNSSLVFDPCLTAIEILSYVLLSW